SYNINRKNSDLKFYEFGNVYKKQANDYIETKHLSIFITGDRNGESWVEKSQKSDFFLLKSYVTLLFNRLGLKNLRTAVLTNDIFSEGISLVRGNEVLAELGVLKKSIIKYFDIKQEVLFADVKWENVIKSVTDKIKFIEISKYPE